MSSLLFCDMMVPRRSFFMSANYDADLCSWQLSPEDIKSHHELCVLSNAVGVNTCCV